MKELFIGKSFYYTGDSPEQQTVDGDKVAVPFKATFKCVDVIATPRPIVTEFGRSFFLKAIIENPKYGKIVADVTFEKPKNNYLFSFFSVNVYNNLVRKYGQVNAKKVAQHMVDIGMTKNMVLDAWGTPERINETSGRNGSEQWIYGNHYIYFRNGRVVDRQRF